jgi:hypothetical protein
MGHASSLSLELLHFRFFFLITRRNRATVNRIHGAFRVRGSRCAVHSERRARGPFRRSSPEFGQKFFGSKVN